MPVLAGEEVLLCKLMVSPERVGSSGRNNTVGKQTWIAVLAHVKARVTISSSAWGFTLKMSTAAQQTRVGKEIHPSVYHTWQ